MKKPIIFLPYTVADMLAQRFLQTEKVCDYAKVSQIMAPNDQAALLALQSHPVLTSLVGPTDSVLLQMWKDSACNEDERITRTLGNVLSLSQTASAQAFAEAAWLKGEQIEESPAIVKAFGNDATCVILHKGAIEFFRDFNNHLPTLLKIFENKLVGGKVSDVFSGDKTFARILINHCARFGRYQSPNPVF